MSYSNEMHTLIPFGWLIQRMHFGGSRSSKQASKQWKKDKKEQQKAN